MTNLTRRKFIVSRCDFTGQWRAIDDSWEPDSDEPIGVGDTPGEAVDNLIESEEIIRKDREARKAGGAP